MRDMILFSNSLNLILQHANFLFEIHLVRKVENKKLLDVNYLVAFGTLYMGTYRYRKTSKSSKTEKALQNG